MSETKRAIAMGFFDGVHIGHAALLNTVLKRAAESNFKPSVLSFDVHPDTLVFNRPVPLINSADGREEIIRRYFGIRDLVFIHFNESLMKMPWEEFIQSFVRELNIGHIVVGDDFCFGYRGEGTAEKLKTWCFANGIGCDIIPAVCLDGQVVSSTRIRELLTAGKIAEANRLLGHPHMLSDTIRSGYHLGTKMGAPTINMFFPGGVLIPKHGVYATKVIMDDNTEHVAVTNIGVRPTVSTENRVSVESHLLDFSGNLYGKRARVEFYSFIRPEQNFGSFEVLSAQIKADAETARGYFEA